MANLKITELDFEKIKEGLKDFLRNDDTFSDYDFEGSGLQFILNLLAYNSHNNAFFNNMVANEMFLDTATLRKSVISKAKALSYIPYSRSSSIATVSLKLEYSEGAPENPDTFKVLPKYSKFMTSIDGKNFIFVNMNAEILLWDSANEVYYNDSIIITEGIPNAELFQVNVNDPNQKFIISNENVDISTVNVRVWDNSDIYVGDVNESVGLLYQLAGNVVDVKSNSLVYWLQEVEDLLYEIYFGNGIIGKKIEHGNVIKVEYLISSGEEPNNAKIFSFVDSIDGLDFVNIETVDQSSGGAEKEDIENIRFSAPKFYEMQNRSVTALDYKNLIKSRYPSLDSIITWGGEDNDPPQYGRVFIAVKPKNGYIITETLKDVIANDIVKNYNVVTVKPIIVSPTYTYININTIVKYNYREVDVSEAGVKNLVNGAIENYAENNIGKFAKNFQLSKLQTAIDDADKSIKSNLTSITLKQKLDLELNKKQTHTLYFNSEIVASSENPSLTSTKFTYDLKTNCYFVDDGDGNIHIEKQYTDGPAYVKENIGTINYSNGTIIINNVEISSLVSDTLDIIVTPKYMDIDPEREQILIISSEDITITMENIAEKFLNS